MNNQKPEFRAPMVKSIQQPRFKYETAVVTTSSLGNEVAGRIQKKLDTLADSFFRLVAVCQISSEAILIFEKELSQK